MNNYSEDWQRIEGIWQQTEGGVDLIPPEGGESKFWWKWLDRINAEHKKAESFDELLEWARDLATVHWVLNEANKDDIRALINDVIQQMLSEADDPAISLIARKAKLLDELLDHQAYITVSGPRLRGWLNNAEQQLSNDSRI